MAKITPHLWFNQEAKEAAEFYAALVPDSRLKNVTTLHNTPSGDCDVVSFELAGQPFMAIGAGPLFKFNPSVSFHLRCRTQDEVDAMWAMLSPGGTVRMPLGAYPFSERYGWVDDKYGLSWQVIFQAQAAQTIVPVLMFTEKVYGKAEEATNFYAAVFRNAPGAGHAGTESRADVMARYGKGEAPDREGAVKFALFTLHGQDFGAMDSARVHGVAFSEAISFIVPCETQKEIDYFWGRLSAHPQAEQCGWLKDRYGLSWQITPTIMNEMLGSKDPQRIARVTKAFLKMKKFDIAALQRAYDSK
jgi:predicted 3-demethylubiquinone-9 3-methyltransferase (glyoxalase superfamily)